MPRCPLNGAYMRLRENVCFSCPRKCLLDTKSGEITGGLTREQVQEKRSIVLDLLPEKG
jgi:hypothetical protein